MRWNMSGFRYGFQKMLLSALLLRSLVLQRDGQQIHRYSECQSQRQAVSPLVIGHRITDDVAPISFSARYTPMTTASIVVCRVLFSLQPDVDLKIIGLVKCLLFLFFVHASRKE